MERLSIKNGYEKTEYTMMVTMGSSNSKFRKVWKKDGKFFVQDCGKIYDVTFRKNDFGWK